MAKTRTKTSAPSNAERTLDIEIALEVLEESHLDTLAYYATYGAAWAGATERYAKWWNNATDRAVVVLARPGDPSDPLEAAFALTCTSKR